MLLMVTLLFCYFKLIKVTTIGLIFCDDKRRIRYLNVGFAGSSHDQRVMLNCILYRNIESYFSEGEYVAGDSAFTPHKRIITCFKKLPNKQLSASQGQFNSKIANKRILVEHCIGMLKGT